jgi:hypothetical protein
MHCSNPKISPQAQGCQKAAESFLDPDVANRNQDDPYTISGQAPSISGLTWYTLPARSVVATSDQDAPSS